MQNKEEKTTFQFMRFNKRRHQRGAEAAQVECTYEDGEKDLLWMSEKDLRENIKQFGEDEELIRALGHYAILGHSQEMQEEIKKYHVGTEILRSIEIKERLVADLNGLEK